MIVDHSDFFWQASIPDLKRGYGYEEASGRFICLICGSSFEKGIIYSDGTTMYEAEKFTAVHIAEEHGTMFDYLLGLSKKQTGLSDLQKNLLAMFYEGYSDNEIVQKMDGGSTSTIRNHRFALREKEKQAKLFLVIMDLLEQKLNADKGQDKQSGKRRAAAIEHTIAIRDDRFDVRDEELQTAILSYFKEGPDGPLARFPSKEKRKFMVLCHLIGRFDRGRTYSEKEVNEVLLAAYHDYVTLRRYLIEYGFMERESDGSAYWVKEGAPALSAERRKQLVKAYQEMNRPMGVYAIRNKADGKMLVGSSVNLDAIWDRTRFELEMKGHRNKRLQQDWKEFGEDSFTFEVLELIEEPKSNPKAIADDLAALEAKWIERLQPFGEKGYNG
ncbi:hypothetical protein SK3146_06098 [Paenibacillus konkukensis]|uniref:DUF2087 domain-containing protein n=1 Tax=Paenibacillus konkukensis TaxID=2020716 RepID=A0ABY4RWP6_9BACL|nr:hypothetical protein SK3146_06098 [Paenibacillus konkukensis]